MVMQSQMVRFPQMPASGATSPAPSGQSMISPGTVQASNAQPAMSNMGNMQSQMVRPNFGSFASPSGVQNQMQSQMLRPNLGQFGGAPASPVQSSPVPPAPQAPATPAPQAAPALQPPIAPQQQLGYQQFMPQFMQPQHSIQQQATGGGNAQQIQNFMSALSASGAGNNNRFMGAPGQGQGAQAGFMGFQQNGNPGYGGVAPAWGGGYGGGQLGYANNMSSYNPMQYAQNGAMQGGYNQMAAPSTTNQGPSTIGQYQNLNNQPTWQNNALTGSDVNTTANGQQTYNQNGDPTLFSDERLKENISPAISELQEFMDALGAYKYEYKNPAHGQGEHISVMAQELEKSKLGASQVIDTPEGKMVNYGGRLPAVQLAATAMLNKKVNDLEAKLAKVLKDKYAKRSNG